MRILFASAAALVLLGAPVCASAQRAGGYTLADVQRHATPDNCWMLIGEDVYVLTDYLAEEHTGEPENLDEWCGKDATERFARPDRALRRTLDAMRDFRIGQLRPGGREVTLQY